MTPGYVPAGYVIKAGYFFFGGYSSFCPVLSTLN